MTGLVHILGWMLVHSLWQDLLIWGVLEFLLAVFGRSPARVRYRIACLALLLMAVLPWATFDWGDLHARLQAESTRQEEWAAVPDPGIAASPPTVHFELEPAAHSFPDPASPRMEFFLPLLVEGWMAGLLLMMIRLGWRWSKVQSLLRGHLQPLGDEWEQRFARLVQLSGVRQLVRVGESVAVTAPLVGGWLKPVIFLPLGAVASMPPEKVEIILLHELAHIVRHDYLVNILQVLVETVFFYHPAVWAVSRCIRRERELACDDQTLAWRDEPRLYAEALTQFEEFRAQSLALASSGNGDLFLRIRRIVAGPEREKRGPGLVGIAAAGCIGVYLISMFLVPVFAAKVMTAQERAAAISSLQQPPQLPPSDGFARNVAFTGKLTTMDGKPLPKTLFEPRTGYEIILQTSQAQITSQRSSTSMSGNLTINNVEVQTYDANASSGRVDLAVWAEGYAPLRKTLDENDGGEVHLDLQLPVGFPGRIKVASNTGQPLPGATIAAALYAPQTRLTIGRPDVKTQPDGVAVFGDVEKNAPIQITVTEPGWQAATLVVTHWSKDSTVSCTLQPALVTSGRIIDRETHRPLAGAAVSLAAERGPQDAGFHTYGPDEQPLTKADAHGDFDLTTLNSTSSYRIYFQARGYAPESFPVQYGDRDQVFTLFHGFRIRGKIIDRRGELANATYYHPINLECGSTLDATPNNSYGITQRIILPKLGKEIPFSFEHLPPGWTDISFAVGGLDHYRHQMKLRKNVDDLVLDMDGPSFSPTPLVPIKRALEITLEAPAGQPRPTGALYLGYVTDGYYQADHLPLANGTARSEIPLSDSVQIVPDSVLGYWFSPQNFALLAGSGPFRRTISAWPAGVIHGAISLSPDLKDKRFTVWPIAFRKPPTLAGQSLFSEMSMTATVAKGYVTPPMPFGGTYAVVLQVDATFVVSSPALIDAQHPLVARDLKVSEGRDSLKGRFLDDKGEPIRFQDVRLLYHPTPAESIDANVATTDAEGNFTIPMLSFDVPGNYEITPYNFDWRPSDIRVDRTTKQPVTIRFQPK